jgi:hypothetical protein
MLLEEYVHKYRRLSGSGQGIESGSSARGKDESAPNQAQAGFSEVSRNHACAAKPRGARDSAMGKEGGRASGVPIVVDAPAGNQLLRRQSSWKGTGLPMRCSEGVGEEVREDERVGKMESARRQGQRAGSEGDEDSEGRTDTSRSDASSARGNPLEAVLLQVGASLSL